MEFFMIVPTCTCRDYISPFAIRPVPIARANAETAPNVITIVNRNTFPTFLTFSGSAKLAYNELNKSSSMIPALPLLLL